MKTIILASVICLAAIGNVAATTQASACILRDKGFERVKVLDQPVTLLNVTFRLGICR